MKVRTTLLISIFAISVLFTGCDKEEKNEPSADRLVSKINYYQSSSTHEQKIQKLDDSRNSMPDFSIDLRYDEQNRITEMIVKDMYGSFVITIKYPTKNTMKILTPEYPENDLTYILSSEGYVISWSDIFKKKGTCIYDNGYLTKMENYDDYYLPVEYYEEHGLPIAWASTAWHGVNAKTYTWEDGNIKTVTEETTVALWKSPVTATTYEYSSVKYVPCNIDFVQIDHIFSELPHVWFGKSLSNMPSKVTTKRMDGSENVTIYRYETDFENYPIRIFEQKNNDSEELRIVVEYVKQIR
jgi:hypothetical protein